MYMAELVNDIPDAYVRKLHLKWLLLPYVKYQDMVEVRQRINRFDFVRDMLSIEDHLVAACIVKYDFGEALDNSCNRTIESAKKDMVWLAFESIAVCSNIQNEAQRTAPFN
jgi:hypothetical protein